MKKALIIVTSAVVFIAVVLFLIILNIDIIIKKGVEKNGSKIFKASVELSDVSLSILSGSCELKGLTISNPEGFKTDYAFHVDKLNINMDIKSILSDTIHIKNIIIESPIIIIEGIAGKNNLMQLHANAKSFNSSDAKKQKKEKSTSKKQEKKVKIDYLKLQNISISLSTNFTQDETVTIPVIEIKDIGGENGTDISSALEEIIKIINNTTFPELFSSEQLKETAETLKKGAQENIDMVKDWFK